MCECGSPEPEVLSCSGSPEHLPDRASGSGRWRRSSCCERVATRNGPMSRHTFEADGPRERRPRFQLGDPPLTPVRTSVGHDHDHAPTSAVLDTGAVGIRATKVSLAGLGITASIQAVIVVVSGSVALLSDTLHNVSDALTAIPLWIAFAVGRRPATKRYTYGFNRAEDWAGADHRHRHRSFGRSGDLGVGAASGLTTTH